MGTAISELHIVNERIGFGDTETARQKRSAILNAEMQRCKAECVRELLERDGVRAAQVGREVSEISRTMSELRQRQQDLIDWTVHTAIEVEKTFADRWAARKAELLAE